MTSGNFQKALSPAPENSGVLGSGVGKPAPIVVESGGVGGKRGAEDATMSIEQTRIASAVEDLGEALFHLSDKLRGSGFLADTANAAEYETVVAAFQALEERIMQP